MTTTISVYTKDVIAAASEYLRLHQQRIDSQQEALIEQELGSWRWPWCKPRSRAQVVTDLQGDLYGQYHMIAIRGGHWRCLARELLTGAQLSASDFMNLDIEHAKFLEPYWPDILSPVWPTDPEP